MKNLIIIILFISAIPRVNAQISSPVSWSYAAKRTSATEAVIYLKATINIGWHIYSINQTEGGPVKSSITFRPSKSYILLGKLLEPKPITRREEVFNMDVMFHEKIVMFTQRVKLKSKLPFLLKGIVEFMACTNKECLPPDEFEFSIPIK